MHFNCIHCTLKTLLPWWWSFHLNGKALCEVCFDKNSIDWSLIIPLTIDTDGWDTAGLEVWVLLKVPDHRRSDVPWRTSLMKHICSNWALFSLPILSLTGLMSRPKYQYSKNYVLRVFLHSFSGNRACLHASIIHYDWDSGVQFLCNYVYFWICYSLSINYDLAAQITTSHHCNTFPSNV